ncbi:MAG: hypothetical protein LBI45_08095 [Bacteroidales bacterium]|jgi:hypothetical protein|nr:hypothetical protein [Bacteroidales bacterium]
MNYYLFSGKNAPKVASAFAPEGTKPIYELILELDNLNELPFEFELVKLTVGRNGLIKSNDLSNLEVIWLDYQPDNKIGSLFSKKIKTIITEHLTGNEGIDWLTAKVNGNGEQRTYYIPRFEKMLNVLNFEKCTYNKIAGGVIIPCFSLEKVKNYSIFHQPDSTEFLWKIPTGLYISETLKKAIQKEKCTGVSFERTWVS